MSSNKLRKNLSQYALNLPGSFTKRKIVVIHSDDWGSIRMPSLNVRERLAKHPEINADNAYAYYDTLASPEDLEALFEVLYSVRDKNNRPAVLTANCLMANPDFDRIQEGNFEKYYYETLDITFERYNNMKALNLWKEGQENGIFIPQFHGREHVNVPFWLQKLRSGHAGVRKAFAQRVFSINFLNLGNEQWNIQRAWDLLTPDASDFINSSIVDGLNLFYQRFHYKSRTAIAPNYTWTKEQEQILSSNGVAVMQGILRQRMPVGYNCQYKYRYRFTKLSSNPTQLAFQRRNIFFEPSLNQNYDFVAEALDRIKISFSMGKPAIIGSHRVNFIGNLNRSNRTTNLLLFQKLLKVIVAKWPDIEFKSANELNTCETDD